MFPPSSQTDAGSIALRQDSVCWEGWEMFRSPQLWERPAPRHLWTLLGLQPCNTCSCVNCKSSYTSLIQKPPLTQTPSTVSSHATEADLLLSHLQTSHRDPVGSFYLANAPKHVPYLLQWTSKRGWSPAWFFQKGALSFLRVEEPTCSSACCLAESPELH